MKSLKEHTKEKTNPKSDIAKVDTFFDHPKDSTHTRNIIDNSDNIDIGDNIDTINCRVTDYRIIP
jgi:hypothetical protein